MASLLDASGLDGPTFAILFAVTFLGALVQGSIGFGLNLIIAPIFALYRPESLPAAGIIVGLPMTLGSALREFRSIDRPAVLRMTLGRLPGVAVGLWIVTRLAPQALATAIGGTVLFAVLLSAFSPRIPITPVSQGLAGWLAGVMGTTSSIGGPPMALLYQHEPGPVVRSTLGAAMLLGTFLSLGGLYVAGEVLAIHWQVGGAMLPAILLGLAISRGLHGFLDRGWLRPCVLALCAIAGAVVVTDGLLG